MRWWIYSVLSLCALAFSAQASYAVPVTPITFTNTITFTGVVDPISSVYIALYVGCNPSPNSCEFAGVAALANIPVGNSSQNGLASFIVTDPTNPLSGPVNGIAISGVYNAATLAPGMTIGIDDASQAGNYLGKTWAQAFPSAISETLSVSGLENSTINTFLTCFNANPQLPCFVANNLLELGADPGYLPGSSSDLIDFSTGAVNGTFTVSGLNTVPEPATWTLMLAGIAGLGIAMRRRKSDKFA